MKKSLLAITCFCSFALNLSAQTWATATIDINQVKTVAISNGDLFWNYNTAGFEVPRDSMKYTIFAGASWIGGFDTTGALHLGAQVYRQNGNDFYPGPVMNTSSYSTATDAQWNKVWKINKTTIDSFLMWFANPSLYPSYTIPGVITSWPGNGDVPSGQAPQLAPYIDRNSDGIYDPNAGDYPCMKGDQALFFMFNDDRNLHGETGGTKLSVEVHATMYAYSAPGTWLDSTIFINYKLYNRSSNIYSDMYWAQWTDFDIGHWTDDYVGCDVERNIAYGYNGDINDGNSATPGPWTYGANPPAQGLVFLRGPEADAGDGIDNDRNGTTDEVGETSLLSHFVYYNNDFSVTGNPEYADDYYGYMSGQWKDSALITYGGNGYGGVTQSDFMFPGNTDPLGWGTNFVPQAPWDEASSGNTPNDRRALASTGPFTLAPAQSSCLDFAYVFGRGTNGPLSSVAVMQNAADSAHAFYAQNNPCTCDENPLAVNSVQEQSISIYPNPAGESINIICGDNSVGSIIEILDINGKVVKQTSVLSGNSVIVNTSDLAAGVYFVRINKGSVVLTSKFIRQ